MCQLARWAFWNTLNAHSLLLLLLLVTLMATLL
jgi:hypothetical protein